MRVKKFEVKKFEVFEPRRLEDRPDKSAEILAKKMATLNGVLEKEAKVVKKSLDGLKIKNIDSTDLEKLCHYQTIEDIADYANTEEGIEDVDTVIEVYILHKKLKDFIEYRDYFDWKDEDKLEKFLKKNLKTPWKYAYDASPGTDGWMVVFSKIELPSSSEIKIEDFY